jgi:hypothetical protein
MAKAKKKPKLPFDNAAYLLISALKLAPPDLHPTRPFHGGGPQPKCDSEGYLVAGLWLAGWAEPHVAKADRKAFDEFVNLAKKQLTLGRDNTTLRKKLRRANAGKAKGIPLKLAHWSAAEASNWTFHSIYAGGAARPAAGNVVKLLKRVGTTDDIRHYLAELDIFSLHLEALARLRDHKLKPTAPAERTLWRGCTDDKATHWLMRLTNGHLALIAKIGLRWELFEGDKDFVLAHVPDDHLEAAVAAALPT